MRVQEKDLEIGKFLEDLVCWVYVYTCSVFNINVLHRLPGGGGGGGIAWKCCGPFSCQ